nr:hypothetical protein GCM10020093_105630 [Planobispora longispora]
MRTTDQVTERHRAESRLRALMTPGSLPTGPDGRGGFSGQKAGGPARDGRTDDPHDAADVSGAPPSPPGERLPRTDTFTAPGVVPRPKGIPGHGGAPVQRGVPIQGDAPGHGGAPVQRGVPIQGDAPVRSRGGLPTGGSAARAAASAPPDSDLRFSGPPPRAASLAGRPPSLPVPPSFEALRAAVAKGAPNSTPGVRDSGFCCSSPWPRWSPDASTPGGPGRSPSPRATPADLRSRSDRYGLRHLAPAAVRDGRDHRARHRQGPASRRDHPARWFARHRRGPGRRRHPQGVLPGPLNLARRLIDGEQIVVGAPGRGGAPITPADPAAPAEVVLDLNTATAEQLDQLPGVGEVLARRITEYRDGNGGFRSVEQLREVSGIGDRKYAEIKDKVRV